MKSKIITACFSFIITISLIVAVMSGMEIGRSVHSSSEAELYYKEVLSSKNIAVAPQRWECISESCPSAVAWIKFPGTNIDYPIVQYKDNDYYLHHLPDGTRNIHGSIFMDCRNLFPFEDRNTIIYGHHMNDNTMFSGLLNWQDSAYATEHQLCMISTPNKNYTIQIINANFVSPDSHCYDINITDTELRNLCRNSLITSSLCPPPSAPLITLSTCSAPYGDGDRFILQGYIQSDDISNTAFPS